MLRVVLSLALCLRLGRSEFKYNGFDGQDGNNGFAVSDDSNEYDWEEASQMCDSLGGYLYSVYSEEDNNQMINQAEDLELEETESCWFGMHYSNTRSDWTWTYGIEGVTSSFTGWEEEEELATKTDGYCGKFFGENGPNWTPDLCNQTFSCFVCSGDPPTNSADSQATNSPTPSPIVQYFRVIQSSSEQVNLKQSEAEDYCQSEWGSHLATLTNVNDSLRMIQATRDQTNEDNNVINCWIGLTESDRDEDINNTGISLSLRWYDGSDYGDFTNWKNSYPQANSDDGCVLAEINLGNDGDSSNTAFWRNVDCSSETLSCYVCQSVAPSRAPSASPSNSPSSNPTRNPTPEPTKNPTKNPIKQPTAHPIPAPSSSPTSSPNAGGSGTTDTKNGNSNSSDSDIELTVIVVSVCLFVIFGCAVTAVYVKLSRDKDEHIQRQNLLESQIEQLKQQALQDEAEEDARRVAGAASFNEGRQSNIEYDENKQQMEYDEDGDMAVMDGLAAELSTGADDGLAQMDQSRILEMGTGNNAYAAPALPDSRKRTDTEVVNELQMEGMGKREKAELKRDVRMTGASEAEIMAGVAGAMTPGVDGGGFDDEYADEVEMQRQIGIEGSAKRMDLVTADVDDEKVVPVGSAAMYGVHLVNDDDGMKQAKKKRQQQQRREKDALFGQNLGDAGMGDELVMGDILDDLGAEADGVDEPAVIAGVSTDDGSVAVAKPGSEIGVGEMSLSERADSPPPGVVESDLSVPVKSHHQSYQESAAKYAAQKHEIEQREFKQGLGDALMGSALMEDDVVSDMQAEEQGLEVISTGIVTDDGGLPKV